MSNTCFWFLKNINIYSCLCSICIKNLEGFCVLKKWLKVLKVNELKLHNILQVILYTVIPISVCGQGVVCIYGYVYVYICMDRHPKEKTSENDYNYN